MGVLLLLVVANRLYCSPEVIFRLLRQALANLHILSSCQKNLVGVAGYQSVEEEKRLPTKVVDIVAHLKASIDQAEEQKKKKTAKR